MTNPGIASLQVEDLRCEYIANPLGLDVVRPRLSWKLVSDRRGVVQSAYQIRVSEGSTEQWDSGKVQSDQSLHVVYDGPSPRSGQRYTWQVRVWDNFDLPSEWSAADWWEMGLLQAADWQAHWIEPAWQEDPNAFNPSPYLRRGFVLAQPIVSARVYVTAHGLYELSLNGRRVGQDYFTPGFTSYSHRLQYQTYDVSELLNDGKNVLGVVLGDGWYRGSVGISGVRNLYGKHLGLLLQLQVRYADGSEQLIVSDDEWKATTGPILKSDLQAGEIYDARLEMPGWNELDFDESGWQGVRMVDYNLDHPIGTHSDVGPWSSQLLVSDYNLHNLVGTNSPLPRHQERFVPIEILTTPNGETVVDMGQNFSGVVQLRVSGPAGTAVRLQHGEALDKDGNFTMEHLGLPPILPPPSQEVFYTLKGIGEEVYTPSFTTQGFRYVKVEGFPGTPRPENFTGIAIYSNLAETGSFTCSDSLLNGLQHNILWSQKSNFLEIPTDCPTRERAGWTGDAQVFVATGSFLMETAPFFTKWLKDLVAEQEPSGRVANIIPSPESGMLAEANAVLNLVKGAAGWGDAATIIPWRLYQIYGDQRILDEQYTSMKAWVSYQSQQAANKYDPQSYTPPKYRERKPLEHELYLWDTNFHWGEWLEPNDPVPTLLFGGRTPASEPILSAPEVATAYFAYSAHLLAQAARVLGKEADVRQYTALSQKVKAAYVTEFVTDEGRIKSDKQASYVRALAFDLLPEPLRPVAARHLAELVRSADTHLGTGFLSTPYLCPVLADNGYLDLAYALLMQTTEPSWLYSVKKGATTIWESWNGIDAEGNPHNSLNHYSYGAIGNWLYGVVVGLEAAAPGYKHIKFQPQPGGGLTHASATYESLYGKIEARWHLEEGSFTYDITVPNNTTATVVIPASLGHQVSERGQKLENVEGVSHVSHEPEATYIEVGSGSYTFNTMA